MIKNFLKHHKFTILIAFLLGFSFSITFFVLKLKIFTKVNSPLPEKNIVSQVQETILNVTGLKDKKQLGILLLGYGGAGHDGGFLTDAIQVLKLDFEKPQVTLISIPRDLWVKLSNGKETKINATITSLATDKNNLIKSGAPYLKKLVSEITGIQIDYFIGVDFVGFQRAIGGNLKGIEVEVSEVLDDPWYPIKGEELNTCGMSPEEIADVHKKYSGFELERQFPCRYKHLKFEKGLVKMEGGEALEYVRSRHGSAEGDVSRGKRQQEVITAIKKKLFSLDTLKSLPGFYEAITKHVVTDIDLEVVKFLAPALEKAIDFKIVTINLSPSNVIQSSSSSVGGAILIPRAGIHNWSGIQDFIKSTSEVD